eukprot:m.58293 g.58293  ORF g.58293 m.58293 type:complete len:268 (-) comp13517_c0_seq1:330-1133(-)
MAEPEARPPIDVRKYVSTLYGKRARIEIAAAAQDEDDWGDEPLPAVSDTQAAFLLLRAEFPQAMRDLRLPPIVLKHQLNTIVHSASAVDQTVESLRRSKTIISFSTGGSRNEQALVLVEDYRLHVQQWAAASKESQLAERFLTAILSGSPAISLEKTALKKAMKCHDEEVSRLVRLGVLTRRDEGSLWLAIPNMGIFVSNLLSGRTEVVKMLQRSKFKELLRTALMAREVKRTKLGMKYLLDDLLGSETLTCSTSASGDILRLKPDH